LSRLKAGSMLLADRGASRPSWLNRILHPRSGGPVSLPFSIVDSSSSHPSIPIFGFKGLRHLLSRNDFNWLRLETAAHRNAVATHCLPTLDLGPRQIFWVSRDPPTMLCPGAGGWRAISRPKNEIQYHIVSCSNGGVLTVESTALAIVSGPRYPTIFIHSARPFR
jgi:hypothetical protein